MNYETGNHESSWKEKLSSVEKKEIKENIEDLASQLHDAWREPRKQESGSYEPRIKKTKDKVWIKSHGKNEVDIANTDYEDLPSDWQAENKASAEVAMNILYENKITGKKMDLDAASAIIHDAWLDRNKDWAPAEQNKPYEELSKEEKAKDQIIFIKAEQVKKLNDYKKNLRHKSMDQLEAEIDYAGGGGGMRAVANVEFISLLRDEINRRKSERDPRWQVNDYYASMDELRGK